MNYQNGGLDKASISFETDEFGEVLHEYPTLMAFWSTYFCAVMLPKLDGQNLARNVLEQSLFRMKHTEKIMLELTWLISRYKPTVISDTLQVRCSV